MQKVPMMPTFPDTVLAETSLLSLEEKGAFWDLLNHMWLKECWLPDDDERIARLIRIPKRRWLKIKPSLQKFFIYHDGSFSYVRLSNDYANAIERSKTNSRNGKIGANKRLENKNSYEANARPFARANSVQSLRQVLGGVPKHP